MGGNSLGRVFTVSSFGESHGKCVGAIIDSPPSGLRIDRQHISLYLKRRMMGYGSTRRKEPEDFEILSGVFRDHTTGAPLLLLIWNRDVDSSFYESIKSKPRPGHADYVARIRYGGWNDYRGGGCLSGRITAGFVAAGSVALQLLTKIGIRIYAYSKSIGPVSTETTPREEILKSVYENPLRTIPSDSYDSMCNIIERAKQSGDSVGGVVECWIFGLPVGIGDPVFHSLDSDIAYANMCIPGIKGVEFGLGFQCTRMLGSEFNDSPIIKDNKVIYETSKSGGILGGISTGAPIYFRLAVRPTPSIYLPQRTVDLEKMAEAELKLEGRFDTCIVPRVVPVVECVTAIVLVDHLMYQGFIPQVLKEV